MSRMIKPSKIAKQCGWGFETLVSFFAEVFEDANFNNMDLAMRALKKGEYDLACECILLEKDQVKAGCLTEALGKRRIAIIGRLRADETQEQPVTSNQS